MTKKTTLIIYLKNLGFEPKFNNNEIVFTKGTDTIKIKRGRINRIVLFTVRYFLVSCGYPIDDYDKLFLTPKPSKAKPTNEDVEAWALDNYPVNEAMFVCRIIREYKNGTIPAGYALTKI